MAFLSLMLRLLSLLLWLLPLSATIAQQIHAHNDYAQPQPFVNAYKHRADFIEADVWMQDGKLVVSHDKPKADAPTLDSLYIRPIAQLFEENDGKVSADRKYTFGLMIDVKNEYELVLPKLIELLQTNVSAFNRSANPMAVQVIISGNRPRPDTFLDYPMLIQFDGRPSELYGEETLRRVALVSDSFGSYSRWNGTGDLSDQDEDKLKRVIKRAHKDGKPIRFWAIPDTPDAWKRLKKLGVDIINTDKVAEATEVLK